MPHEDEDGYLLQGPAKPSISFALWNIVREVAGCPVFLFALLLLAFHWKNGVSSWVLLPAFLFDFTIRKSCMFSRGSDSIESIVDQLGAPKVSLEQIDPAHILYPSAAGELARQRLGLSSGIGLLVFRVRGLHLRTYTAYRTMYGGSAASLVFTPLSETSILNSALQRFLMNHEAGHSLNRLRIVEAARGVLRRALALLIPAIVLGCHWDQTIHSLARVVAVLVFVVMWVTQYPNRFRKVDDEVIADNFALRHAPDEILSHLLALHPSQRTRTDPDFPPYDRTLGDTNDNRRERFWQQVDARRSNRLIAGWPADSIKPDRTRAVVILICLTTVAYLGNPRSPVCVLAVFGVGCVLAIAELLRVLEKDRRSEGAMESMLARSKTTSRG